MTELKHYKSDTNPQIIVETLKADGALILDNVVSTDFIGALRSETDPYMNATINGQDDFSGRKTTRTGGLMLRSQKCRELIADKRILAPCNEFLAPFCERVQLHLTQIIRIRGGETAQAIHRDRWAWGKHLAHVEPQFNTIWAITDFTAENGATQVVPGSTQWPDDAEIGADQITQAEMNAGSVLIYSGSVFHGGGANGTDTDRIGINITYTLAGFAKKKTNISLARPNWRKIYRPNCRLWPAMPWGNMRSAITPRRACPASPQRWYRLNMHSVSPQMAGRWVIWTPC